MEFLDYLVDSLKESRSKKLWELNYVNKQNGKWINTEWDITSNGKNANWDKRSKRRNVGRHKILKRIKRWLEIILNRKNEEYDKTFHRKKCWLEIKSNGKNTDKGRSEKALTIFKYGKVCSPLELWVFILNYIYIHT